MTHQPPDTGKTITPITDSEERTLLQLAALRESPLFTAVPAKVVRQLEAELHDMTESHNATKAENARLQEALGAISYTTIKIQRETATLREALKFYASPSSWREDEWYAAKTGFLKKANHDAGAKAREALGKP